LPNTVESTPFIRLTQTLATVEMKSYNPLAAMKIRNKFDDATQWIRLKNYLITTPAIDQSVLILLRSYNVSNYDN